MVGLAVGVVDGATVGVLVGLDVGIVVGLTVGDVDGATVGLFLLEPWVLVLKLVYWLDWQ